jgi:sugar lactone lactonase YvrE
MSTTSVVPGEASELVEPELVIREARRRRRRRWIVIAAVVGLVVGAVVAIVGTTGGRVTPDRPSSAPPHTPKVTSNAPTAVQPERPESLAVGPNGNLYMADGIRNQILERLPGGSFVPVAGNGTAGFSGDGGSATEAELDDPAGITFGPNHTLYIADLGNGRIRAVSPTGTITTIAGDGGQTDWVADGTPALAASIEPSAMAFGPDGLMYVATGSQVLRLGADGALTRVLGEDSNEYAGLYGIGGPAVAASADGPDGLAFDAAGNLYVAGFNTKTILMVDPAGTVRVIGTVYPRGNSGLVTGPGGSVLAMDELSVDRLTPQGIQARVAFPTTSRVSYLGITGFSPNGIAVASNGDIYLDTFYGNGYADKSALIMINRRGSPSLLWEHG